jgi:hypothetical protein
MSTANRPFPRWRVSLVACVSECESERLANGSHLADREFTDRVYGHTPGPILVEKRERERQTWRQTDRETE